VGKGVVPLLAWYLLKWKKTGGRGERLWEANYNQKVSKKRVH